MEHVFETLTDEQQQGTLILVPTFCNDVRHHNSGCLITSLIFIFLLVCNVVCARKQSTKRQSTKFMPARVSHGNFTRDPALKLSVSDKQSE